MALSDDKPKKGDGLRRWLDFIFGFRNQHGEIVDSWLSYADGFSCSPTEFYESIRKEMDRRKIPSMAINLEKFGEGGPLSDQRIYLRLMRERLALITCAAPFGNYFFFSCRTIYIPALVRLWHLLAAVVFFLLVLEILVIPLGLLFSLIALAGLVFALAGVMRNASASGFLDLDTLLLKIPVIATIYEDWFREDTYYRIDTRSLYVQILPELIEQMAEDVCAAKGVRLERQFDPSMIVADLSQPLVPQAEPPKA